MMCLDILLSMNDGSLSERATKLGSWTLIKAPVELRREAERY